MENRMSSNGKPIRVVVVDDHAVLRDGLKMILAAEKIEVVGDANNGQDGVNVVIRHKPDVVVMDIKMPILDGIEAAKRILKNEALETKVVFLTAYDSIDILKQVLHLGMNGYILKETPTSYLVKAIRESANGKTFFTPRIAKELARLSGERTLGGKQRKIDLTPSESQVLQLVAEGSSNKEIADIMRISIKTVEKHRQWVMNKLNIHDTSGLTRYYLSTSSGGRITKSGQSLDFEETEVVFHLASGCSVEEVADKTSTSPGAVQTRLASIKRKLGIEGVEGIRDYAINRRMISE